jgi:hypothetical protein
MTPYIRLAVLLLTLNAPLFASYPLVGHFRPAQGPQVVGGPVFVIFEVVNTGNQRVSFRSANPLNPCAGYRFVIDGEHRADDTCDGYKSFSCVSDTIALPPGGKDSQNVLLNFFYDLPHAGPYSVLATREVSWWTGDRDSDEDRVQRQTFEGDVELDLQPADPAAMGAVLKPYIQGLASPDHEARLEAMQALEYPAQASLESTFIEMLSSDDWNEALAALRRLNSPRARKVLAQIAEFGVQAKSDANDLKGSDRSSEQYQAIGYLGEMGDPTYLSLLLKIAQQAPRESQNRLYATWAVGELGGPEAISFLVSELNAPDHGWHITAAVSLASTASRDAVPVFIDLLESPDADLREVAENGLETLTHRVVTTEDVSEMDPAKVHSLWADWWKLNSAGAQMYGEHDCGDKLLID